MSRHVVGVSRPVVGVSCPVVGVFREFWGFPVL